MQIGRLPVAEQLDAFREVLVRNDLLVEVLARAARMDLPGWYLTAGCLFQTVWNVVTGRPAEEGIKDYDLFYFDDSDLGWAAEDEVIRLGDSVFGDLPAIVEIRNEARVHLWYEDHFGVPCPPHTSSEAAIDSFAATTCCVGVRLERDESWRVYAPHGFSDIFNMTIRPNPVLAPAEVYEAKARRWQEQWPDLTVLPWPSTP
ncbi:nucleotidyltransferase family protein [Nocardia mexicana]|uniref:Nucleotidyltransferase family protein n=1 Tax=Nocardia mexicana TaxID=279262 RepID=A0A370GSR8_9NOCA|nr:nucleotidyltransferase family protein [Nocardia mexicana]RDI46735.1 hypothetical protein DFR68_110141 [Nocardia mexicana]